MMRILALLIMFATVAAAAPATNKVVVIKGKPAAKSLLKTQSAKAIRAKDSKGKTVDLPLMFDNNRLPKIKKAKDAKK